MSLLALATRPTKAIDQESMSGTYPVRYVPLENHQTWTGAGIAPETGLGIITVYQCVRVLAETFASLPLIVYRRLDGGGKERATEHPLYETLHSQPNPDMTSFVWRELMMTHLATWGNAYCEKVADRTGRLLLYPIRPDRVEPLYDGDGNRQYDYIDAFGQRKRMRPGSIFHIQGMGSNGLMGFSPIHAMRTALGLYKSAERFGEALFRNNARPGTVLKHPATLSVPAQERLRAQMDSLRGDSNAFKTVLLEEGLDFAEIGIPPEDAQFLETRVFQKREIAAAYRIQPHKVGDLERATFSNIEHQSIEFIQDTMLPWFVRTEQAIATQLIEDEDIYAEFLVDGYLRGDAKTRAEALSIRWQHGNINADDWRAMENENPLPDGLGQTYYVPANYKAVNPPEAEPEVVEVSPQLNDDGFPPLVRVKSSEVRCPECNRLLAELATPPYKFTCTNPKCKTPVEEVAA